MADLDIRIKASFYAHPKLRKLRRRIGDRAAEYLVNLWIKTAQLRPKGILQGWDDEEIALSAGFEGEPGDFITAMLDCGWLDTEEDQITHSIHDWEEHQPYIFYSEERSEKARKAALSRWEKEDAPPDGCGGHAGSMQGACGAHAKGNAPSPTPTPLPTPSPSPKKEECGSASPIVLDLIQDLNSVAGKMYSPTPPVVSAIEILLHQGYTVEQIKQVHRVKAGQWKGDAKMDRWLRPLTLYDPEKFAGYINEDPDLKDDAFKPNQADRELMAVRQAFIDSVGDA